MRPKYRLERLQIAGYKSIRDQQIELRALNVLIGANGAGKSNFIEVFRLLNHLVNQDLQLYTATTGGADRMLHFGSKTTEEVFFHFTFGQNKYKCKLIPTRDDNFVFGEEVAYFHNPAYPRPFGENLGRGHKESQLLEMSKAKSRTTPADHVLKAFKSWRLYHFHDTSEKAKIKQIGDIDDNRFLRSDAGNLAAVLYYLQEAKPNSFNNIVDVVRMAAPFFRRFDLQPDRLNKNKIKLEWNEQGSDAYFDANSLSDGTLRFISMATLLLQPRLPKAIVLDEPELGLHPYAIILLAELLRSAAERTQVIVSTQSVTLVNQMSPDDVIIVDRQDSESIFRRLSSEEIASWLDDYSLGELWEKNVLGGRPGH